MSDSLEIAAARLVRELPAPPGALNALAMHSGDAGFIRVLIDPTFSRLRQIIPLRYDGFLVVVDVREPTIADAPKGYSLD